MGNKNILAAAFPIAAFMTLALSGCAGTQKEQVYPFPFESARIEYQITGNVEGTTTVLIKGDKQAYETTAVIKGADIEEETKTKIIDAEGMLYQIDLVTGTGQSMANPIYEQLKKLAPEERMDFLTKLAVGISDSGGVSDVPQPKGQKTVAGETCDLYDIQSVGEICLWNGIPIYSSMSIPEAGIMSANTATSIQLNVDIPDSAFNVPEGVKMTETTVPTL